MLLDEESGGRAKRDDQIRRPSSIERLEIFNKFGLGSGVAIQSRNEGLFSDVQWPRRLSVQCFLDFSAPCGTLLEIRAERMKEQKCFRLTASAASVGLSGGRAY